jgi:hypothetical protein
MTGAKIQLLRLHEAHDRDGEPAVALLVPALPGRYGVRPTVTVYPSLSIALGVKRALEGEAHASPT